MTVRATLPPVPDASVVQESTIPPGVYWSIVVPRGQTLRFVDVEGAGSGSILLYNARQPSERYNAPDTVKIQNQIHLTAPMALFSDMGRIMASITADTAGCHDTLSGATTASTNDAKYDVVSYLEGRNDYTRNARDNFVAALGRHGLDARDIVMPCNLWSRVEVVPDGALVFVPGTAAPGAGIDLRAEMDLIVVVSNTPHVLDPSPQYAPGPIAATLWRSEPPTPDDACRTGTPERQRGAHNTDAFARTAGSI